MVVPVFLLQLVAPDVREVCVDSCFPKSLRFGESRGGGTGPSIAGCEVEDFHEVLWLRGLAVAECRTTLPRDLATARPRCYTPRRHGNPVSAPRNPGLPD